MVYSFCYSFALLLSAVCCSYVFFNLAFAMPETLIPYLSQVLDFGFSIIEILMQLICVLALYATSVLGYVFCFLCKASPYVIKVCSGLFSVGFGVGSQVIHGVLGNSDPTTNVLSWVFMLSAGFLYFDTAYRLKKDTNNTENNRDNNEFINHGLYYEDNTRNFMIQPEQLYSEDGSDSYGGSSDSSDDESDQNDLENRENENEANFQNEASYLRMRDAINTSENAGSVQPTEMHEEDRNLCNICFERDRNIAVFPCGHVHMCLQCVQIVEQENNLCPVCQGEIEEYKHVFL